jgi:lysozyme
MMTTSSNGISLIEKFEGFSPQMYKDAVGIPTIGYGTRIDSPALQSLATQTITQSQGEDLLKQHLTGVESDINGMVQAAINQNQFDALISFCYNLGTGSLRSSTLLKKLNVNPSDVSIRDEFNRWVYAGNQVLPGLVERRKAEADLYFTPVA